MKASWTVALSKRAQRDLDGFPVSVRERIELALDRLAEDILTCDVRKLEGMAGIYRLRVGTYRVQFSIDLEHHTYLIERVDHRRDAYR